MNIYGDVLMIMMLCLYIFYDVLKVLKNVDFVCKVIFDIINGLNEYEKG